VRDVPMSKHIVFALLSTPTNTSENNAGLTYAGSHIDRSGDSVLEFIKSVTTTTYNMSHTILHVYRTYERTSTQSSLSIRITTYLNRSVYINSNVQLYLHIFYLKAHFSSRCKCR
jgi:hypothetical protein